MKSRAELARQRARRNMSEASADRRDKVAAVIASRELPTYSEDIEESTGRFAAVAADAAANAVAKAMRKSAPEIYSELPGESLPPFVRRIKHGGKIAAAVTVGLTGATAFAHWVLGFF